MLEAATAQFLGVGYAKTSMDDIADAAGVSKRTVYNNFADKEALFREVVLAATAVAERFSAEVAAELSDPDDLSAALIALARRQVLAATSPRLVQLRRLLIGEACRFPDLAAEYYDHVPGRVMSTLADAVRQLAAGGRLRVDDPSRAAEHFAFLVLGATLDRALFTAGDGPRDTEALERAADDGVRAFLAAYGPVAASSE